MHSRHVLFTLLLLFGFSFSNGYSQCTGNAQAEATTCGSTPVTLPVYNTCGNCTHTWSPAPIAGQNTALATYQFFISPGFGTMTVSISSNSYNPNIPCSYGDMWLLGVAAEPNLALPALVNGPWNGDTSKVWIYARTYYNPYGLTFGNVDFYPNWNVTGGTILRSVNHRGSIYFDDSVFVKWSGPTNMQLNETQLTYNYPQNMQASFSCNWNPTGTLPSYPSLSIFNQPICQGTPANFFTFPFANSTYTWSVTNGTVIAGQGTNSAQIALNGTSTITVLRDSAGTITSTSTTATPVAPIVNLGPDQNICQGGSLTLTADPGFSNYAWSNGASTQSITVSSPGQYSVTASIGGSCLAIDTINLSLVPTVAPSLGPDQHACAFPLTLDAGSGYAAYAWSGGQTTQTIQPSISGTYRVTVTDGNGCLASDTVLIYNAQVGINLPSTASYCDPATYTINPGYQNTSSYLWSNGATTATIPVTGLGTQTFWVQGSNAYGCQGSDTIIVTGNPSPTVNAGPNLSICPGSTVTLNAGPGFASYHWASGPFSQTYTVSAAGNYYVTVTNSFACPAVDTVLVSSVAIVPVNLGPDINVCQGSATLNAGLGYSSYIWSNGATASSIVVNSPGAYAVTVTGAGGCTYSDTIQVTFGNFSFNLGNNITVCEPQTVTLDRQLVGNFSYLWSNGATTPTLTLSTPNTYNLSLSISNSLGCTASDNIIVTILPTLPSFMGSDTVLCADTTITLNAGPGFVSYNWSTGASTQTIVVANGGSYRVTATDANGCLRLDTILISGLIDCVFPGDVNYDGNTDLIDVLALGTSMGATGTPRANASNQWYGQMSGNWTGSVVSGVNRKQADTNGDGIINQADTLAIQLNYGSIHTRYGSVTAGNNTLSIRPLNSQTVIAGDMALFGVFLEGPANSIIDSVHGMALKLSWPAIGQSSPSLAFVDHANAWFAPSSQQLPFGKFSSNSADIAISRTVSTDTAGQGLVLVLGYQTDSNFIGQPLPFAPVVNMAVVVGMDLILDPLQSQVTPITVDGTVAVLQPQAAALQVWPIPADAILRVTVDGQLPQQIQLTNMMGQHIMQIRGKGERDFNIDTAHLPAGTYFLQVQTKSEHLVRKVIISH